MTLRRFSSRTEKLDKEFLSVILKDATKYHRIAGYFRSSIFELVGEEIAAIPEVKILCNSELDLMDFQVASGRDSALKEKWNQVDVASESILYKDHYRKLNELLTKGNVEIRVVPRERLFLHGKAGVISYPDGRRVSFIGSVNETKNAFASNYELVWQDDDTASADWVEEEFTALWEDAIPLPDIIISEINRVAERQEIKVETLKAEALPAAAMVEAPLYRGGEQLQPWQRSFVSLFIEHRAKFGKSRLLIADEVGLGKTLSMATGALVSALLDDGPVLILAPSTLLFQWQVEMKDRLGVPSAVWSSQKKVWIGSEGQQLSVKGLSETIKACPCQIAIVSTGLIFHQFDGHQFGREAAYLLSLKYGTVILDEAHKARAKGGIGISADEPNNLLNFMKCIAKKTRHLLLGTATPIQTKVSELWDLLEILNTGAEFVLGDALSQWRSSDAVIPFITGKEDVHSTELIWQLLSNPLPPGSEDTIIGLARDTMSLSEKEFYSSVKYDELDYTMKEMVLPQAIGNHFFEKNNPVLRHVVLRKRKQLEDDGLLDRVGVETHPLIEKQHLYNSRFTGIGLLTNNPFEVAYRATEQFCKLLQQRTKAAGFMKTLLLQRLCSSFASGLATANAMLKRVAFDDDENADDEEHILKDMTPAEINCLKDIVRELSRPEARDPKLETVRWFLTEFTSDNKHWLEHGCIIFSQYFDTSFWVARELAKLLPEETIAVYAGAGKSGLFRNNQFNAVERESIKRAVKTREIRLVVATDAACEGLNLQTLGTLINVDLPWNPSRLEQRLGRIKRFGQARRTVDMLNLVYHDTQDEKVYSALSQRLKDTYDIFGSLPDTIQDDWIDDEEKLIDAMDEYIHLRKNAENAFTVRYRSTLNPNENRWELCSQVLSRRDIEEKMSEAW